MRSRLTLCGFSDFDDDVVGGPSKTLVKRPVTTSKTVVKKPTTAAAPKPPAGKKTLPKPKKFGAPGRSGTIQRHGKTLASARATAARSVQAMNAARKTLQKHVESTNKGKKTAIGAVVAAVAKKLNPKAKAAVDKHNAATKKAQGAAKKLATATLRVKKAAVNLARKTKAQKSAAVALRGGRKRKPTRVRGIDLMGDALIGEAIQGLFEEYYAVVGSSPDPYNPGYLGNGSMDPAYFAVGQEPAEVPTEELPPETPTEVPPEIAIDEPMDTGADLPPPPSMDQFIADMTAVSGIPYNNEKGTPNGYCGSMKLFTKETDKYANPESAGIDGTAHYGYVWGKFDAADVPNGVAYGNQFPENTWVHVHGKGSWGAGWRGKDNHNYAARYDSDGYNKTTLEDALTSNAKGYGPLIGNPGMKDFVGMRVDGKGNRFWLPQEAPGWLTVTLKLAADATARAEAAAAAEAAQLEEAQRVQQQADQEQESARQEAEKAMAESESQAKGQADAEQGQLATQMQQVQAEQTKTAEASQTAMAQVQQQAQQQEQEGAQQEADLQAQYEALMQQAQMQQGPMQQPGEEEAEPYPTDGSSVMAPPPEYQDSGEDGGYAEEPSEEGAE